jgi:hypothetical protein
MRISRRKPARGLDPRVAAGYGRIPSAWRATGAMVSTVRAK